MVQILCDGARCDRAAQEIRCSRRLGGSAACVNGLWVSWREGIRGSCESCAGHPGTETQDDVDYAGSEKERSLPGSQREQRSSSIKSGTTESRSGATTSRQLKHWREKIAQARQEGSQTVPERPPVGESQSNGIIERAVGLVAGQTRTLKAALEHRIGARVPPDARILCWLVEFAACLMNMCDTGMDGKTPLQRPHGRRDNTSILEFGEKILYMPAKPARGEMWEPRFHPGVSPSRDWRSRQGRRTSGEYPSRRDGTLTACSKWGPLHGPRMAVTMRPTSKSEWRDPRRWCPETQEVMMENKRTYLRRADFEQWGLSGGCPGCQYLRTGQERQQAHSEASGRGSKACERHTKEGQYPKRRLHWTQSRNRHHAPRSRMEDLPHQAHDPAPPKGLHRTPTRVTGGEGRDQNSHRA